MKNRLKNIKYTQTPFSVCLTLIAFLQGLVIYLNANKWDYIQHTKVAQYLIVHEIEWDSFKNAKHAIVYPMYHILIKLIHLFGKIDYKFSIAVLMIVCNIVSIIILRNFVKLYTQNNSYLYDFLSIFTIVFIAARGPLTHWRYYIFITGPNPIHNPTFILVRPLGLLCFYCFCRFFTEYKIDKKNGNKYLVGFGILALFSVFAKPSFAVVYLPAMGLYTFITMVKNKDILIGIRTFIAVLPTLITLIWQQRYMSANSTMLGVEVHFGSFSDLSVLDVIMVTIAFLPSALLLINFEKLRNDVYYLVALLATIIGWLQFYFLDNGNSGDFSWGYALSIEVITFISLIQAQSDYKEYKNGEIRLVLAWLAFFYQCFMGLLYLYKIYKFGEYWI